MQVPIKFFVSPCQSGFPCFRALAEVLKRKIPETYQVFLTVETAEYGLLPVKRKRGKGSNSTDLATRIGDNFFNKFFRLVFSMIFSLHLICIYKFYNIKLHSESNVLFFLKNFKKLVEILIK